jgi:hypothetical protein
MSGSDSISTLAALSERRQAADLEIAGGHSPPLQ